MQTHNYETIFIANIGSTEARLQEINDKNKGTIEKLKGKFLNLDDWGKRRLAYPIQKEYKGHYYCLTYSGDNQLVSELERGLRLDENVVRFMTVKLDKKVDPMVAIAEYKKRLEAHAKREKERAEREAEKRSRGPRREFSRGDRDHGHRSEGPKESMSAPASEGSEDFDDADKSTEE